MTILEKKVELLTRLSLTEDLCEQEQCKKELRTLIDGRNTVGTVREEAEALLIELGVPEHILGSKYAAEAICAVVQNAELLGAVTRELYPVVAEVYASTPSKVERAIRHAVELSWDRGDTDVMAQYFGNTVSPSKGKPTNSEFIARCASIIRQRVGRK